MDRVVRAAAASSAHPGLRRALRFTGLPLIVKRPGGASTRTTRCSAISQLAVFMCVRDEDLDALIADSLLFPSVAELGALGFLTLQPHGFDLVV